MITKTFLTAGDAIFTVEPSAEFLAAQQQLGNEYHPHYTYRIARVELKASGNYPARTAFFVSSLTGRDNTSDYTYLGELIPATGEVRLTRKSAFPETASRVRILRRMLTRIWDGEGDAITNAGWKLHHEGKCGRCARLLTTPKSCELGIGPECRKAMAA